MANFVVVTGGVMSGIGKGIASASIGALLKSRGLKVNLQKLDPYLNVDSGTLSPIEHGECFITDDGAEADLDLGHYERFLDQDLTHQSSLMSGRVISDVIAKERRGGYLGQTVQLVPHLTSEVEERVTAAAKGFDVHIVEIGGTVGDYESPVFFEAMRALSVKEQNNVVFVQLVYVPFLNLSNEYKTKPAQNAFKDVLSIGIVPDIIIARTHSDPEGQVEEKLRRMTGMKKENIIELPDSDNVYEVPLSLAAAGMDAEVCSKLGLQTDESDLTGWEKVRSMELARKESESLVKKVGILGKYLTNGDAYKSVLEALKFSSWYHQQKLELVWIDAELSDNKITVAIDEVDGLLIPGGFGSRGIEGMVHGARYCIDNDIPYLGLCLGMQVMAIAAARRAGLTGACSTEYDSDCQDPVITILEGQDESKMGGTMRLGAYVCSLSDGSIAAQIYDKGEVSERHRHRYEFNPEYKNQLGDWGLDASGLSPDGNLVEIIETSGSGRQIACQSHPELKARPLNPHPLFNHFVGLL